jgi:hypothetical protein
VMGQLFDQLINDHSQCKNDGHWSKSGANPPQELPKLSERGCEYQLTMLEEGGGESVNVLQKGCAILLGVRGFPYNKYKTCTV